MGIEPMVYHNGDDGSMNVFLGGLWTSPVKHGKWPLLQLHALRCVHVSITLLDKHPMGFGAQLA